MSKGLAGRLAASAAASIIVAGTGLIVGSGAAFAAPASSTHTVSYSCKIPVLGSKAIPTKLTLSAPSSASVGSTVKLKVKFTPSGLPAVTITKVTLKSSLTESGAQKGSVPVKAYLASANSGSLTVSLSGSVKLTKAGRVSFSPASTATFSLTNSILGTTSFTCKTTSAKLPVLGTITVTKGKSSKHEAGRLG
jgi:hypothetical protein